MIRFRCECGRQLQADESNVGQPARCPLCNQITTVPANDEPAERPPPRPVNEYGEITRRDDTERSPERRRRSPRVDDWDDNDDAPDFRRGAFSYSPQPCADANTALWMGIVGLFCCTLLCPFALIYGIKALNQINKSEGRLTGTAQAVIGLVLGAIGLLAIIVQLILIASGP